MEMTLDEMGLMIAQASKRVSKEKRASFQEVTRLLRTPVGGLKTRVIETTKVVVMKERKFGPSDFQKEILRLQKEGRMPSLQAVLQAVGEIREVYRPSILLARQRMGK